MCEFINKKVLPFDPLHPRHTLMNGNRKFSYQNIFLRLWFFHFSFVDITEISTPNPNLNTTWNDIPFERIHMRSKFTNHDFRRKKKSPKKTTFSTYSIMFNAFEPIFARNFHIFSPFARPTKSALEISIRPRIVLVVRKLIIPPRLRDPRQLRSHRNGRRTVFTIHLALRSSSLKNALLNLPCHRHLPKTHKHTHTDAHCSSWWRLCVFRCHCRIILEQKSVLVIKLF